MVGGDRVGERGYFVAPTVLDGAGPGNKVFDEIFGPVVTAIPFKDLDEVTPAANPFRGATSSLTGGGRWAKR